MSLVDEEIKIVKQREDELRKDRANLYGKDRFNNERMLSNHMDTLAFDDSGMTSKYWSQISFGTYFFKEFFWPFTMNLMILFVLCW